MGDSEMMRFKCLELAINTPDRQGKDINPFNLARKYYTFVKEKDGDIFTVFPFPYDNKVNSPSSQNHQNFD